MARLLKDFGEQIRPIKIRFGGDTANGCPPDVRGCLGALSPTPDE
jgi:hypothetical protein